MTQVTRLLALALVLAVPATAIAQTQTGVFGSRLPTVSLGKDIWVTSKDGREVHGRVLSSSPERLQLTGTDDSRSFTSDEIQRIEVTDRLANGAIVGALVGAAPVAIAGIGCALEGAYCDAGSFALGSAVYIGVGAGVGALIDMALKGRESIYESVTAAPSVSVTPLVGRHTFGVGGVIRWGR